MDFGLFGEKLGHSYSPLIHAMLADYTYTLCECTPEQMRENLIKRDFVGMNVTIPYKRLAYENCDTLSDDARRLGNVNTLLVQKGGKLHGENTDVEGFRAMVQRSGVDPSGKKAAVLGSGGSGHTAVDGLRGMGASQVIMVSRSGPVDYQNLYDKHSDIQILVNATPVGMYPSNLHTPVDPAAFPRLECVLDLIYNPYKTELLLRAEKLGIPTENGLWMLVAQAHRAAELFTGNEIPHERITQIHQSIRKETENIILIGMPGSGKTSIGIALAESLGREFIDTDDEIVFRAGKSIPDIFSQNGEGFFRDLESEVLHDTGKRKSLVVATGGGVVLREDNWKALWQNGIVFFLTRSLSRLERQGRPLSIDDAALARMYDERLPLYLAYSHRQIANEGTIEQTAQSIKEEFDAYIGLERP